MSETAGGSGRILLVEDDRDARELLGTQLRRLGYGVTEAQNAAEGLSSLRAPAQPPDLVILDRYLPDIDGSEVLRTIRGDPRLPTVPVVIVSGDRSAESISGMLDAGAADYLVKPVPSQVLEARVTAVIREARGKAALLETQHLLAGIKQELQLIFDAVSEAILLVDADLVIRRANRAALKMAGAKSFDQILGRKCHDALCGRPAPCPGCLVETALRDRSNLEREADFQTGDRLLRCRQRVFLVEYPGDRPPAVLDVIEDITEQRRRGEEKLQAERLGAVVRLAGGLAHEISQPLAAVSGRAELLQMAIEDRTKPINPADLARHVENLRENCRRMGEIVHRLQNIDEYVTRPYYGTTEILDLGRSSTPPPEDGKEPAGK